MRYGQRRHHRLRVHHPDHNPNSHDTMVRNYNEEWLTPEEAASFLGLSRSRIYHLKPHLTHRKGKGEKSRVLFLKSTLLNDYMNI